MSRAEQLRANIRFGTARAQRHRYLVDLAKRYSVELPPMPVGEDDPVYDAVEALERAGVAVDPKQIEITTDTPERRNP